MYTVKASSQSSAQVGTLKIGSKSFKVTSSFLMLVKSLYDYLLLPAAVPLLTTEIVSKMLQSLQV